jgi:hypothetical protein
MERFAQDSHGTTTNTPPNILASDAPFTPCTIVKPWDLPSVTLNGITILLLLVSVGRNTQHTTSSGRLVCDQSGPRASTLGNINGFPPKFRITKKMSHVCYRITRTRTPLLSAERNPNCQHVSPRRQRRRKNNNRIMISRNKAFRYEVR